MKEFKKGDRVVLMRSLCSRWNVGQTFVVDYLWPSGVWVTLEGVTQCVHVANLMNEREFVGMCIDTLAKNEIVVRSSCRTHASGYEYAIETCTLGPAGWYNKKDMLDLLFPTETPQQKRLRELEEQQRAIADQIKSLREEM